MFTLDVLKITAALFVEIAPYMMFGLLFAGLLNLFFKKDLIVKHIGKNNISSIVKAALLGVPLPLCSCGVIPTSVYLAKNGASKPSIISFLISTPQTGVDSIIATYGMMGWLFAIYRPIAAFLMGILGGIIAKFISPKSENEIKQFEVEEYKPTEELSFWGKCKSVIYYSYFEFLDDITAHFIVGMIIAGLITYFIPDNFFTDLNINSGILGMLVMIAIGVPMYVCATASIPIALTLMMKGFSPGVAFVFLAAGPATNAASITVLSSVLGKRMTAIFVGVIALTSLAFGLLLDEICYITGINPVQDMMHIHTHEAFLGDELSVVLGIIFAILLLLSLYRKYIRKFFVNFEKNGVNMSNTSKIINIEGMNCNHCAMNVKKAIEGTKGVSSVEVVLNENKAIVDGDFNFEELKQAVENVGYKVK